MLRNFFKKNLAKKMNLLLKEIFSATNHPYFESQIKEGLIEHVQEGFNNTYDFVFSDKVKKFESFEEADFTLSNILVLDNKNQSNIIEVKIIANLVAGLHYENKDFDFLNIISIDTSNTLKKITKTEENIRKELNNFGFSSLNKNNISQSQLYILNVSKKEYIHLRDILDGGFIGLLEQKLYIVEFENIYLIPEHYHSYLKENLFSLTEEKLNLFAIEIICQENLCSCSRSAS